MRNGHNSMATATTKKTRRLLKKSYSLRAAYKYLIWT